MKTTTTITSRLVGVVERIELVDKMYGISEEDRCVLDAIRGVRDLVREGELSDDD